jgi:hypothetical protein
MVDRAVPAPSRPSPGVVAARLVASGAIAADDPLTTPMCEYVTRQRERATATVSLYLDPSG